MKFKIILSLIISFYTNYAHSMDRDLSYDITALNNAKLVVTAKIIPGKDHKYHIIINNILKKVPGITLTTGDKINVMVSEWGSFGNYSRVYDSEYILYLHPYKNTWISLYGEHHIKATENGLIPFEICDKTFLLSIRRYEQMKNDMHMCFEHKGDYQYTRKISLAKYNKTANPLAVVQELYKCHNNIIYVGNYIEQPMITEHEINLPDTSVYGFCEIEQGLLISIQEYMNFLNQETPDSIRNNKLDIQGKIYIKFIIETDSTGSQFQVVKGIYPPYDEFALNLIKKLSPYKPGIIQGKAVRSHYTIPVIIRNK